MTTPRSNAMRGRPRVAAGGGERPVSWGSRQLAIGAALWIAGVVLLAVMSVFAQKQAVFTGDVGIARVIQSIQWPPLVRFINLASDANWPYQAGVTVIVVVAVLVIALRIRAAICAAVAGFAADLVNVTLNGFVARPRPNNVQIHVIAHLGLHSFPSGHVTHVVTFYGFLFYLSHRSWKRGRAHAATSAAPVRDSGWIAAALPLSVWLGFLVVVQVISAFFIVLIGPSRVLEGEHWPSDVVASYLLGSLMLVAVILLYHLLGIAGERIERRGAKAPLPAVVRPDTRPSSDSTGEVGHGAIS